MASAWGSSWGSAWGDSWGSTTAVTVDTHDGFDEEFENKRKRAELREQIRYALEGPLAVEVREALEPVPQDSPEPLYQRVDVGAIQADVVQVVQRAYQAYLTELEEEELLLLT